MRSRSHNDRLASPFGMVSLLDCRKEGVHIYMQNDHLPPHYTTKDATYTLIAFIARFCYHSPKKSGVVGGDETVAAKSCRRGVMDSGEDKDLKAYLARIRKTIADSKQLVSQAELRIAETDRMLERQGLTREQVMAMRFSDAQMDAVNAELKRRGLDPLERWTEMDRPEPEVERQEQDVNIRDGAVSDAELVNRQRKFGMMMKPFQL